MTEMNGLGASPSYPFAEAGVQSERLLVAAVAGVLPAVAAQRVAAIPAVLGDLGLHVTAAVAALDRRAHPPAPLACCVILSYSLRDCRTNETACLGGKWWSMVITMREMQTAWWTSRKCRSSVMVSRARSYSAWKTGAFFFPARTVPVACKGSIDTLIVKEGLCMAVPVFSSACQASFEVRSAVGFFR